MIKDISYYLINYIINRIPSRKVRMYIYSIITKGRINKKASISVRVQFLNIMNVYISDNVNINRDCIIDGRGGKIIMENNVDIAPQVNIWTLQHDVDTKNHDIIHSDVIIHSGAWICNRAIILPGSIINKDAVIGAGVSFKGIAQEGEIIVQNKYRVLDKKKRTLDSKFKLSRIRRFR
ncbi:acyltransferase [Morganella morganii]|uniref:acyltransferase n=1 Tax=Morganella morganii TaxID=582 RepID=UPI00046AAF7A|nr:hypothetical protein [Morganella morganii]